MKYPGIGQYEKQRTSSLGANNTPFTPGLCVFTWSKALYKYDRSLEVIATVHVPNL